MYILKKLHILNLNNLIVFNSISVIIDLFNYLLLQLLNDILYLKFKSKLTAELNSKINVLFIHISKRLYIFNLITQLLLIQF